MNNPNQSKTRLWIETAIAGLSGVLAVVTIFWKEWIEITGWDPDHGNGAVEWLIVLGLAILAIIVGAVARRDWRVHKLNEQRAN